MSHPIYYASITDEARYLEQLASASKQFISTLREVYPEVEEPTMVTQFSLEVANYQDWLINTVSNRLIACATRMRVLQDSYDFSVEEYPEYSVDKEAFNNIPKIVEVIKGDFKQSIRECCNKIIHATSYELEFEKDSFGTEYWTGCCILSGQHNKKEWSVKLNTMLFGVAIREYIEIIKYM